jgi:hypothetical protein
MTYLCVALAPVNEGRRRGRTSESELSHQSTPAGTLPPSGGHDDHLLEGGHQDQLHRRDEVHVEHFALATGKSSFKTFFWTFEENITHFMFLFFRTILFVRKLQDFLIILILF